MNAAGDRAIPSAAPLSARIGAWIVDALALAYAGWAVHVLWSELGRSAFEMGFAQLSAGARNALLVGAPLGALLWGALAPTLGQRALGLELVDEHGAPPLLRRRAMLFLRSLFPLRMGSARGGLVRAAELSRRARPRARRWTSDPVAAAAMLLALLTVAVGWTLAEVQIGELLDLENLRKLADFAAGFLHPDWRILGAAVAKMVETIFLALMATLFAVPVAGVLAFFAARNVMPNTLLGNATYLAARTFFTFVRSTEPIVWAIVFCAWVGIGPFAGTLALFVHSVASLVKLYSEAIEQVDPGPTEALRAVGAGPIATILRAVVPQVVPPFVAFTMYRWDINVRMATILGMVGAGGIGLMLLQNSNMLRWPAVAVIILCITAVVLAMDLASAWIRRRIR